MFPGAVYTTQIEGASETKDAGWGSVLLGGFSSIMDGVVAGTKLEIDARLKEQYPETYGPASSSYIIDPAGAEAARGPEPITWSLVGDAFRNANPVYIGGVLAGVVALYLVLK